MFTFENPDAYQPTLGFAKQIAKLGVIFISFVIGSSHVASSHETAGESIPFTGGKYNVRQIEGKRDCWHDLEIETQDHRQKIIVPLGYECSSATCVTISPGGHSLYVSGVHGGSGKLWVAQYDLVKKNRVKNLDALIPVDSMIPICIQWNDTLQRFELKDGLGKSSQLRGVSR